MKNKSLFFVMPGLLLLALFCSCSRPSYYTNPYFNQVASKHKIIAILPAEMIYTGILAKNVSPEAIAAIEEKESTFFQQSLFNGILRNANGRKYIMYVNVQDITTTAKMLDENHISIRNSWRTDDKELAKILGVDAVVRMRVTKKRYMSDLASFGIHTGEQVLSEIGSQHGFFIPYVPNKTNDIYASCNVICNTQTIWNDSYKGTASWNYSSETIINNITEIFGRHFPYKKRI